MTNTERIKKAVELLPATYTLEDSRLQSIVASIHQLVIVCQNQEKEIQEIKYNATRSRGPNSGEIS